MLRKNIAFGALILVAAASVAGIQMARRDDPATASPREPACSAEAANARSRAALGKPSLVVDYAGAEAMVAALGRDSLSEANVDSLLGIRGVCAMVDNVTRFFPRVGVSEFRKEIREFVRTKRATAHDGYFRFSDVSNRRANILASIAGIRNNDRRIADDALALTQVYRTTAGVDTVIVYFVAGGVSTGFAFDNDSTSLYANLVDANPDLNGIVLNVAHESYHVFQAVARARAGIVDDESPAGRLFATTLAEGTANFAADPTRWNASSVAIDSARDRYLRNSEPKRISDNFALFDKVLAKLQRGRMTWEQAYAQGFTNLNDNSFYFVGYEMAKAIDQYCGHACIGQLFERQPVEFFRRYVALYQQHPEIRGRFSKETEAVLAAHPH